VVTISCWEQEIDVLDTKGFFKIRCVFGTNNNAIVKYIGAQTINGGEILIKWGKTKTWRFTEWNPIGMTSKGRPNNRWGDKVLGDLNKLKVKSWTYLVKGRKV
jgi:hypothetical protein